MTNKEIVIKALLKVNKTELTFNIFMSVETFLNKIIFSPEFAKAYWGEREIDHMIIDGDVQMGTFGKEWQYHQHKMLDEVQEGRNPLKYLGGFLEEE